jgi:hypothetical protein
MQKSKDISIVPVARKVANGTGRTLPGNQTLARRPKSGTCRKVLFPLAPSFTGNRAIRKAVDDVIKELAGQ